MHRTLVATGYAPKHMWKPVLKQMVKTDLVDMVYFNQHTTLRQNRVDKEAFEVQRSIYKSRYTEKYIKAKVAEIERRKAMNESERLLSGLDSISDFTMATFSKTISTEGKTQSSDILKGEVADLKLSVKKANEDHENKWMT